MKNRVKKYGKGMLAIAGTGIGVGLAGTLASEMGATELGEGLSKASGTLTPLAVGLYTLKFGADILSDSTKKSKYGKNKKSYW